MGTLLPMLITRGGGWFLEPAPAIIAVSLETAGALQISLLLARDLLDNTDPAEAPRWVTLHRWQAFIFFLIRGGFTTPALYRQYVHERNVQLVEGHIFLKIFIAGISLYNAP